MRGCMGRYPAATVGYQLPVSASVLACLCAIASACSVRPTPAHRYVRVAAPGIHSDAQTVPGATAVG